MANSPSEEHARAPLVHSDPVPVNRPASKLELRQSALDFPNREAQPVVVAGDWDVAEDVADVAVLAVEVVVVAASGAVAGELVGTNTEVEKGVKLKLRGSPLVMPTTTVVADPSVTMVVAVEKV